MLSKRKIRICLVIHLLLFSAAVSHSQVNQRGLQMLQKAESYIKNGNLESAFKIYLAAEAAFPENGYYPAKTGWFAILHLADYKHGIQKLLAGIELGFEAYWVRAYLLRGYLELGLLEEAAVNAKLAWAIATRESEELQTKGHTEKSDARLSEAIYYLAEAGRLTVLLGQEQDGLAMLAQAYSRARGKNRTWVHKTYAENLYHAGLSDLALLSALSEGRLRSAFDKHVTSFSSSGFILEKSTLADNRELAELVVLDMVATLKQLTEELNSSGIELARYDSIVIYWDNAGIPSGRPAATTAEFTPGRGRQGFIGMPIQSYSEMWGALLHEFFHNVEHRIGIKPSHGFSPTNGFHRYSRRCFGISVYHVFIVRK